MVPSRTLEEFLAVGIPFQAKCRVFALDKQVLTADLSNAMAATRGQNEFQCIL